MRLKSALFASASLAFMLPGTARADEGMWTFDAFPAARMKAAYGWAPDQAWLDKTRAAAVRLTGGCSASFVSDTGLILTNHHCVATCVEENSTADNNILVKGFTARSMTEEKKCAGQQAEVVTSIRDVTPTVKAAIGSATGADAVRARNAATAKLESDSCTDKATTRCQVVSLYGGGQYKLYTYRKYSDVRLAWAPEAQAAQFGGDPDNFNFPRYSMDASFLRAYENGKPVATPAFLKWNPRAPQDGEATFVVGNPGSTSRLFTGDQLAFQRELALPIIVTTTSELRGRMIAAMAQSPERKREAAETLSGLENSLKVFIGRQKALNDPAFTGKLAAAEASLKQVSAGKPGIGIPWGDIARSVEANRAIYVERLYALPSGDLFNYALALVRVAAERGKPNGERLPGYTDSALPLLEKNLTDERPVTPWLDQLQMEFSLSKAREYLGADHPQSKLLLGRESPEALAARLVTGTKLADPAARKALLDGGAAAIAASTDPMIVYARSLDPNARALQKRYDAEVDAPLTAARARLADARFAVYGDSNYPDATFTLRISYGKVQGWNERGTPVPTRTVMGGTFDRATGAEPFDLPPAFAANQARINKNVTYDFVTTNDIIGGNSGSPVIDRAGTVIGAAFDGNIHSLGGNYGYDGTLNRTVVVSTAAVQEALEKIYPAPNLVAELRGRRR
ncbi:S46 family peptidase [Sphingomonas glaciei]|uniref:Dipeptidyl-peptidase n=1 Tax=Sphingomonas glaciei TaxID=2938948 RepID=A0ABY5MSP9_9SPHN|nr:S46 family peptidase [Sphingomonas glaciei]UUR07528.1 S46 family peptidase [Sphingomonas glaciei]